MLLNELYSEPRPGYQSEKDDKSPIKVSNTRKTRLTLADLNRLRMANDVRKVEHESKLEQVSKQYKPAAPAGPMM